ncbi:uncharacterized protein [Phaenicophaeus curvirostris]|uniref:uncharacterized protein n=1 Tax=Phaenicophaeus curvirostris TaxID=33595 RepID=UPI0037F0FB91
MWGRERRVAAGLRTDIPVPKSLTPSREPSAYMKGDSLLRPGRGWHPSAGDPEGHAVGLGMPSRGEMPVFANACAPLPACGGERLAPSLWQGPWGAQAAGAMASAYRTEHISTYGQGHGEPHFESDRRHGPFGTRAHEAFGYPGSPGTVCPCSLGTWVHAQGDTYQVVADVSQFEPPDIVVTTSNCHIAIQAEKVAEDGTVCDTFTHKCQLPEDTDPLSVSCALTETGTLVITAHRRTTASPSEPPQPQYRSEATL